MHDDCMLIALTSGVLNVKFLVFNTQNTKKITSNAKIIWHKLQCNSILARCDEKWYKYLNIFLF